MNNIVQTIKEFIEKGNLGFFNEDSFCNTASEAFKVEKHVIAECLEELVASGFLVLQNNKLVMARQLGLQVGSMQVTMRGFGFCTVDISKPDIFVARENLHGAIHGDRVLIKLKQGAKRQEGTVEGILSRSFQNVVGTVIKSKTSTFIIPDDERLGQNIEVRLTAAQRSGGGGIISGQKVVAKFDEDLKSNKVHIIETLGDPLKVGVDILSIIRHYNLYQEFPQHVIAESRKAASAPIEEEIKRRLDLREKVILTIDPDDAKDLDDGVSLEKCPDGTYELGVHIADVSHYVRENSELDKEAFKRGTSVYFCDRVLPMLPPQLSNDICSLNPHEPRLALSVFIKIDKQGNVVSHKVAETVIKVHTRFDYKTVQQILDGDETLIAKHKEVEPILREMAELTLQLEKSRRARGEVVFDVPEPKIVLDGKTGKIKDVIAYPHLLAHRVIESFMVLCNEVVAKQMSDLSMPFVYRIHESPDPIRVARLVETLKPFSVDHRINPENPTGVAYQKMLETLDVDIKPIISSIALRSMQKAKYSPDCIGHFGLGAKHYCHFTSPIRRYPDLVIHRIIKMMLNRKLNSHKIEELSEFVVKASEQSSKTELTATEAEREVDNLKRAEFMQEHIGEKFTGHISGIADFGVFVYLPNTVEGLIKIENMPKDNYAFSEKQMLLVGKKKTWRMGDKIEVTVAGVNMTRRQVEFAANS